MTPQTVKLDSFHIAMLDPMTGYGVVALPLSWENVWLGTDSVHATAWNGIVRQLDCMGWDLIEDEDGCPMIEGITAGGGMLVAVMHLDPINSDPSIVDIMQAQQEVLSLAGREHWPEYVERGPIGFRA